MRRQIGAVALTLLASVAVVLLGELLKLLLMPLALFLLCLILVEAFTSLHGRKDRRS